MQTILVKDKESQREFLNVVEGIYKDDKAFIRPLDQDIE